MGKELFIGGQAVVEGVLMRSRDTMSVAVRKPNGKIIVKKEQFKTLTQKKPWSLPFLRGMIILFETVYLGMKAISWSATQATDEEEEEMTRLELIAAMGFSLVLALVLFKFIPLGIASLVGSTNNIIFNLIDGLSKVVILVGYIWAISFMDDVKRLFMYHGAEHMTVNCYEHRKALTIKNIKKFPKEHQRCGTTFILLVLLTSIIFYLFIPLGMNFWAKLGLRILLLPLISGVSYELIRLIGKHHELAFYKLLSLPGIWLQLLTTRDPDDEMIEVAIKSLKAAV